MVCRDSCGAGFLFLFVELVEKRRNVIHVRQQAASSNHSTLAKKQREACSAGFV